MFWFLTPSNSQKLTALILFGCSNWNYTYSKLINVESFTGDVEHQGNNPYYKSTLYIQYICLFWYPIWQQVTITWHFSPPKSLSNHREPWLIPSSGRSGFAIASSHHAPFPTLFPSFGICCSTKDQGCGFL